MLHSPLMARAIALALLLGPALSMPIFAQNASIQDCLGAIPVCQKIYEGQQVPAGNGNVTDFGPDATCLVREDFTIWYTFTVDNSGQFGFLLTPDDPNEDFDWVLFDITNASCEDLDDDPSLIVSCNAAGGSGCTGETGAIGGPGFTNQGPGCFNPNPDNDLGNNPFNALIDVQAGNTYALCISNFTRTALGYTLDFGYSTDIGIFDEQPPVMESAAYLDDCNGQEILVGFSEFVQCATLSGNNFLLGGNSGPYDIALSSANCDAGGNYAKEFVLIVTPPVPAGEEVTLELIVDGSTEALDLCNNPGATNNFLLPGPLAGGPLDLGSDTTLCSGNTVTLSTNLSGSYIWSDGSSGSSLIVSTTGTYWLRVNTPDCGLLSDTIEVEVIQIGAADAILGPDTTLCEAGSLLLDATAVGANYLWQDGSIEPTLAVAAAGTYSVTVTSDCGEITDEIIVIAPEPIDLSLSDADLCPGDSIIFDLSTPGVTYQWQDGSTASSYTVRTPGNYAVTVANACDSVELTASVGTAAGALPAVDLGPDTTLCSGQSLLLSVEELDALINWQDGSQEADYLVTAPGTYSVTVTNDCGSRTDAINVGVAVAITADLPTDTVLCLGESLVLDVTDPAAESYTWQDRTSNPIYRVNSPGSYSVLLSNACEEKMLNILVEDCEVCHTYVPNAFSPNEDGINDRFRPYLDCTVEEFQLRIYNRWGNLLFESASLDDGWDGASNGRPVEMGVYIYEMIIGVEEEGQLRTIRLSGDVTIAR